MSTTPHMSKNCLTKTEGEPHVEKIQEKFTGAATLLRIADEMLLEAWQMSHNGDEQIAIYDIRRKVKSSRQLLTGVVYQD